MEILTDYPPNRIHLLLFVFGVTLLVTISAQLRSHVINYLAGSMGILCGVRSQKPGGGRGIRLLSDVQ